VASAKLPEPSEEIHNQMARLEEVQVILAAGYGLAAGSFDYPLSDVERVVAIDLSDCLDGRSSLAPGRIVSLAAGGLEPDRVAQRVDQRMDPGGQSRERLIVWFSSVIVDRHASTERPA